MQTQLFHQKVLLGFDSDAIFSNQGALHHCVGLCKAHIVLKVLVLEVVLLHRDVICQHTRGIVSITPDRASSQSRRVCAVLSVLGLR